MGLKGFSGVRTPPSVSASGLDFRFRFQLPGLYTRLF